MKCQSLPMRPAVADSVDLPPRLIAAPVVRVRLYGDTDVFTVPRHPTYKAALSAIRSAIYPVVTVPSNVDMMLLNSQDLTILSRDAWPLLFHTLYEIVVKYKPTPVVPFTHSPATPEPEVTDLTQDTDDEEPTQLRRSGTIRVTRAPSPIAVDHATEDRDAEEKVEATSRRAPACPVARIGGTSNLVHGRRSDAARRSASRFVPIIKPPAEFGAFPEFREHDQLERAFKRRFHWVVPPKDKHSIVHEWLNGDRTVDGLTGADGAWLGRHQLRNGVKDERKFVDEGRELFNLLVRAHGKHHLSARKTWERVHEVYLGPSNTFVKQWVNLCPTCCKRR